MKDFIMKLLGYKKSPYQGYKQLTWDEYMAKLDEASSLVRERANVVNVFIKGNPEANSAWMDKFPVGTWITDEDGHRWDKREDGRWYFHTEGMTSAELSKDGTRWTWVRSENE